jgi:hypothetical protein
MVLSPSPKIPVRRVEFRFPKQIDPQVVPGSPFLSSLVVAGSLLLPYLEPYLIRTMKTARPHVKSHSLQRELASFSAQEGQHYRQHAHFNRALTLRDRTEVEALEAELDADYRRFTSKRSLRFNLAYAEGFEAFTSAIARFMFEADMFEGLRSDVSELLRWHFAEEIEHRTVAFDAYQHVYPGYFYRVAISLFAQWHLVRFLIRASRALRRSEHAVVAPRASASESGGALDRRVLSATLRVLLPATLATYLPGYTPHRIAISPSVQAALDQYSIVAATAG